MMTKKCLNGKKLENEISIIKSIIKLMGSTTLESMLVLLESKRYLVSFFSKDE